MAAINSFNIKNYKKKLGSSIAMFRAGHFLDVFFGEGWTTHARFTLNRTRDGVFVKFESGTTVPPYVFRYIIEEVNK